MTHRSILTWMDTVFTVRVDPEGRGALAESDAEAVEQMLAPWTSEDETETLVSTGKVAWGDEGG